MVFFVYAQISYGKAICNGKVIGYISYENSAIFAITKSRCRRDNDISLDIFVCQTKHSVMIIRHALFLMLNLLLLACSTVTEERTIDDLRAIKEELLIQDGAWCWFSDPRAVYHRGAKEQIYFGYINSSGDVCIGSKDLESEQLNLFVLHDTLEIDDHNVPSILVLPNGKLLAFYNEHNGNVYLRQSTNSEDISSWEGSRIVARETEHYNYCYTNPLYS